MATLTPAQITLIQTAIRPVLSALNASSVSLTVPGFDPVVIAPVPQSVPLVFDGLNGLSIGSANAGSPVLILTGNASTPCTTWNPTTTKCTLAGAVLTSTDGQGFGGDVKGDGNCIRNVSMGNLNDGFHLTGATNTTIDGVYQTGPMIGRCVFFVSASNVSASNMEIGPSGGQSPIRFEYLVDSQVTNVYSKQVPPWLTASFPLHCVLRSTFTNCTADGGEFSMDTAGDGYSVDMAGNRVKQVCINVTVVNLKTLNGAKVRIGSIATGYNFSGGSLNNSTGECISIGGGDGGGVIDGVDFYGGGPQLHAVHFYGTSPAVIRNCRYHVPKAQVGSAKIIDGQCTKANDGGGNVVVGV